jgi:hypothetical protein
MPAKEIVLVPPSTLPKTISEEPLEAAITFTTNSGAEVPKATTVNPIMILGIPKLVAKPDAASTSLSAPKINRTSPVINKSKVMIISTRLSPNLDFFPGIRTEFEIFIWEISPGYRPI